MKPAPKRGKVNGQPQSLRRLVVVNTVSDAVICKPPMDYVSMVESSPTRQVWMLRQGDVLVTAGSVPPHMVQYILSILGSDGVVCVQPTPGDSPYLIDRVLSDEQLMKYLTSLASEESPMELWPFVLDSRAVSLAERLGIGVAGYGARSRDYAELYHVAASVVAVLNAKSGFREAARSLGLPVARGNSVALATELRSVAQDLAESYGTVIIKRDRSSNGYAHKVMRCGEFDNGFRPTDDVPHVVEEFVAHDWAPSIEIEVTDDGPRVLYPCDQRCIGNSWTGMIIPPHQVLPQVLEEMTAGALSFGGYLYDAGYRGICDVDGLASRLGRWVVTETNLRVTGGTHVHVLLERLVGADYLVRGHALSDSVLVQGRAFSEFLGRMRTAGILFDMASTEGVLVTSDGSLTDGRFRYVVYGRTLERASDIEEILRNL
jgi:hypothetical protein